MVQKNRAWMTVLWFVLAAALLAACSAGGPDGSSSTPPQTMMTSMPETMATQMPGNTLNSTPVVPDTGAMEFDAMFINMMVPHHQGAVEMAKIAQQRAEHPEIQEMANAIVSSQQEEITQMKNWKQQWYGSSDTPPMSQMPSLHGMEGMGGAGHAMDMQAEVDRLQKAQAPFDLAFIDAMIPHHQSAIDAAQQALQQASHPEIKRMAQAIIEAQQKEIDQMNAWRKAWYPDAAPLATPGQ